jgi:tRNA threonylcarbamoyl adenosine modification protein YeaZ
MTQVMLAIDTSAGSRVAVLVSGEIRSEVYEPDVMKHAEQIGVLLKEALSQAGVSSSQVTNVAVGVGPAPFTGLRVGIAAAKMFSDALGIPLFGIGCLDAIAYSENTEDTILVLSDARRGEVYFGLYKGHSKHGVPIRLEGPGVIKRDVLEADLKSRNIDYRLVETPSSAGNLGRLAMLELAEGSVSVGARANYLRAPDVSPSIPKKVSTWEVR